jgi:DNA-binding NarL/FixJ family response regulator
VNPIRVLLAVEPRLLREALAAVLAQHNGLMLINAQYNSIDKLIRALKHQVDVVILTCEPTSDVPALVRRLLAQFPDLSVIVIHPHKQCIGIYRINEQVHMASELSLSGIIRSIFRAASKQRQIDER